MDRPTLSSVSSWCVICYRSVLRRLTTVNHHQLHPAHSSHRNQNHNNNITTLQTTHLTTIQQPNNNHHNLGCSHPQLHLSTTTNHNNHHNNHHKLNQCFNHHLHRQELLLVLHLVRKSGVCQRTLCSRRLFSACFLLITKS